ncbi:MAG: sulfotransferase domain-containing protein [Bacteroidota bacterium]|nr:MAG: sulfotransferase domain-containing protein [Bacteroidota bacterium]
MGFKTTKLAISLRNKNVLYKAWLNFISLLQPVNGHHLKEFLLFVGYPRSGSSTLGSLLDAHPQIIVAHELNALNYLNRGFSRRQIFTLLIQNSIKYARSGRFSSGYPGLVPGQHNGKSACLKVLGDKKAGGTALALRLNDSLLHRLQDKVQLPLKCLHLVRNPFDMITTQAYGGNEKKAPLTAEGIQRAMRLCFEKFDTIQSLIQKKIHSVHTLRYEALLENPVSELSTILSWLEVDGDDAWLDACCRHLYQQPHRSRSKYNWTADEKEQVMRQIEKYPFLQGYTFEN